MSQASGTKGKSRKAVPPKAVATPRIQASTQAGSDVEDHSGGVEEQENQINESDPSESDEDHTSNPQAKELSAWVRTHGAKNPRSTARSNLFGDGAGAALPKMPVLVGPTAAQYSDWVGKAVNYFQTQGLEELVLEPALESLGRAIRIDGGGTTIAAIKAQWCRIHTRIIGAIKSATEGAIGTDLFDEIEMEQEEVGSVDPLKNEDDDFSWVDRFLARNANHVWVKLKEKQQRYTAHDLTNLIRKLLDLKLQAGSDPTVFRRQFTSAVKELKNAKISLPEEVLMSVWLQALPRELSTLKQALGARSDLKWMDIYEALVGDYSSRMFSRAAGSNNRQPAESASVANETQHRDHRDHQQKKRKFSVRKVCSFCKKGTHSEDKCWSKHPHLRPNHKTRTRRSQEDTDDGVEHYMPFVDAEILNQFNEQQSEVVSESALASPEQLPNDNVPSLHFIFDSAATSHVVNSTKALTNITDAPETAMTTALRGSGTVIRKRGEVRLNKKWKMRDVAYVPNGSANLLSEGRLCDAGYSIWKNKDCAIIRDADEKVVLKGIRWNRLWIYSTNGAELKPKPLRTIVEANGSRQANASGSKNGRASSSSQATAEPVAKKLRTGSSSTSSSSSECPPGGAHRS